jgi:hypothetical protein
MLGLLPPLGNTPQHPVLSKKPNRDTAARIKKQIPQKSCFRLRSQTLHQRLKGGGTNPFPWLGFARKKKATTSMLSLFSFQGGVLPPSR